MVIIHAWNPAQVQAGLHLGAERIELFLAAGFYFSEADGLGGDFDLLVVVDVFHGLLQGEAAGGYQAQGLIGTGGPDIGQFFFFGDVDPEIFGTGVFADDQPGIDRIARVEENGPSRLEMEDGIGHGPAGAVGNQDPVGPGGDGPGVRRMADDQGIKKTCAAGIG
jgi:hypothetical protein